MEFKIGQVKRDFRNSRFEFFIMKTLPTAEVSGIVNDTYYSTWTFGAMNGIRN